jgi:hypothetical protein
LHQKECRLKSLVEKHDKLEAELGLSNDNELNKVITRLFRYYKYAVKMEEKGLNAAKATFEDLKQQYFEDISSHSDSSSDSDMSHHGDGGPTPAPPSRFPAGSPDIPSIIRPEVKQAASAIAEDITSDGSWVFPEPRTCSTTGEQDNPAGTGQNHRVEPSHGYRIRDEEGNILYEGDGNADRTHAPRWFIREHGL